MEKFWQADWILKYLLFQNDLAVWMESQSGWIEVLLIMFKANFDSSIVLGNHFDRKIPEHEWIFWIREGTSYLVFQFQVIDT